MGKIELGISSVFALKRWLKPKKWMEIIHTDLDLDFFEFSLDLLDPRTREPAKTAYIQEIVELCDDYSISVFSVHTGHSTSSSNLMHPDLGLRIDTIEYFEKAIDIAAAIDASAVGGYVGSIFNGDQNPSNYNDYLIDFLSDSLEYLAKIAYTAGMNYFLVEEPTIIFGDKERQKKLNRMLQKIFSNSKIPINSSISMNKHYSRLFQNEDLKLSSIHNLINKDSQEIPLIHLQQTDGTSNFSWTFTKDHNKQGIVNLKNVFEYIDDINKEGCKSKIILDVIPSFEITHEKAIEELKDSLKFIKEFI